MRDGPAAQEGTGANLRQRRTMLDATENAEEKLSTWMVLTHAFCSKHRQGRRKLRS